MAATTHGAEGVDYLREIRPIISSNCLMCHGPDEDHRQADLRLDEPSGIARVVQAGDLSASELIARITSEDSSLRMPPVDSGLELTPEEIERLKQWVLEGGIWSEHWAFVPPVRPAVPDTAALPAGADTWMRNPIDAFVLERLQREGLSPSPQAEGSTLLRRLALDLVGLPPTLDEARQFVSSGKSDAALDAAIEAWLASPHFGEKWGRMWLDAARYADSDGFEKDKPRRVHFYRDFVIQAFNEDLPYNEFLVAQIAGDLLPEPTQDQIVATGFLRNSMLNEEGGIDPEQFRMEAMFDRMDAVGKAVLGLTLQCGQCHNHKYDPLTQAEYYRMFACLNNAHEASITVYTPQEQQSRRELLQQISDIERQLQARAPDWRDRMREWEQAVQASEPEWTVLTLEHQGENAQRYYQLADGSILAQGYAPTRFEAVFTARVDLPEVRAIRLELLNDPDLPAGGPGRSIDGLCALTEFRVTSAPAAEPQSRSQASFAQALADFGNERTQLGPLYADHAGHRRWTGPIEYAIDGDQETAWGIDGGPGRRNDPRQAIFLSESNLSAGDGETILTFHLEQKHGGWNSDDNQNMNLGRFRISAARHWPADSAAEARVLPPRIVQWLSLPEPERTAEQQQAIFSYWRTTVPEWQEENDAIEALWALHPHGSTQLVMQERVDTRITHRLQRGDFLKPEEEVSPGVPEFLHGPDPEEWSAIPPRLAFARWLADDRSPTTARAIVNRIWQAYFGIGLVETAEDFGLQGDFPSHPELLDWLACELIDSGWSLKHIHRLIVQSATYRQSSQVTPELHSRDPENRLLARGPRFRIDAELVRDVALASSGLLNPLVGGPSVYPPAPEFLFKPPVSYGPKTWEEQTGPEIYRRAMYTFRFRSVPYPMLQTFDAPNGDFACVRRSRSNTPLQALTTLNEPLFLDCARALARRVLAEGGSTDDERIELAFQLCLTRLPTESEQHLLRDFLAATLIEFDADPAAARALALTEDTSEQARHLAAWTALSRVLLNLDEMITKE